MNKLLISEISIDLHLQSFTHLAQQNLEGKKKRERKYIQLLTPFSLLLDKDVLTEGDHLLSHQAGGRKCQEGAGERTNSHSFAPVSISTITPFLEQAQVRLLFRQTLPQIQIQTPAVCSASQPTHHGWNGKQRKQHGLAKVQKHFSLRSTFLNVFSKCKSSEFIQMEAASRD